MTTPAQLERLGEHLRKLLTFEFALTEGVVADGTTFTLTMTRETRTLLLNGAQTAGTTSVPFRAQATIATRHWTAADTITLARTITATLDITGDLEVVLRAAVDDWTPAAQQIGRAHV